MENQISLEIPAAEYSALQTAAENLRTGLEPYVVALTPEERSKLPKMGQISLPFVQSAVAYFETNPEFAPPFVSLAELKKDFKAVNDLTVLYRKLSQIVRNLEDTIMLCGSESYIASLSYYNSVKQAAKINVPNAKPIVEDLKQRFSNLGSSSPEPVPVPVPAP